MAEDKCSFSKPDQRHVSHAGPPTNDEIAEPSDEDLERYMTQNDCPEEKRMYRANPDFIVRKIAGEIIAVPTGKTAYKLNATMVLTEGGAILWEKLAQAPQTKADLIRALQKAYDVEPLVVAQDVASFLEKALTIGVIDQE